MAKSMPVLSTTGYKKSLWRKVSSQVHLTCSVLPHCFWGHPANHFSHWGISFKHHFTFNSKSFCSHFKPCLLHHIHAMLPSLTLFHIMSTPQSLVLHAHDYHACTSTAAFETVIAIPNLFTLALVIALTERWLTDKKNNNNEILPSGYC